MNNKLIFHYLSYLQYPFLIGVLYFTFKLNTSNEFDLNIVNNILVLMGLAVSFSTLQDTKKVSMKFEKGIWENPKKGNLFISLITIFTFLILVFGIFGYFFSENENVQKVAFGSIVLGIGFVGFTKVAIEVFENHRKDKNKTE